MEKVDTSKTEFAEWPGLGSDHLSKWEGYYQEQGVAASGNNVKPPNVQVLRNLVPGRLRSRTRIVFSFVYKGIVISYKAISFMLLNCQTAYAQSILYDSRPSDCHSFGLAVARCWIVFVELQRDTIDTVSLIGRRCVSFSLEDMAQVTSAIAANYLCSCHAEGSVCVTGDSTWDGIEVGGPATTTLELVLCLV